MTIETLSDLIQSLSVLKRQEDEAELVLKEMKAKIRSKELELIAAMDSEGIKESKNHQAKVAIQEATYPQVESWDSFGDFILNNRWLHLLERRPAVLAYRELLTLGKVVPGVLPFTKRKLYFKES